MIVLANLRRTGSDGVISTAFAFPRIATTRPFEPGRIAWIADVALPDRGGIAGVELPLLFNGAAVLGNSSVEAYAAVLSLPRMQQGVCVPPARGISRQFRGRGISKAFRRSRVFHRCVRRDRAGDHAGQDQVPARGRRSGIDGRETGMIAGTDFNSALLAVWLGKKPVTRALKEAMVGVDKQ